MDLLRGAQYNTRRLLDNLTQSIDLDYPAIGLQYSKWLESEAPNPYEGPEWRKLVSGHKLFPFWIKAAAMESRIKNRIDELTDEYIAATEEKIKETLKVEEQASQPK